MAQPASPRRRIAIYLLTGVMAISAIKISIVVLSSELSLERFFLSDVANDIGKPLFFFALAAVLAGMLLSRLDRRLVGLFSRGSLINALLVVGGVAIAVVGFELALRPFYVVFNAGMPTRNVFEQGGNKFNYSRDETLGYVPQMGPGRDYSKLGTQRNDYPLEKRAGWRRILFAGDSITAIGHTQEALANQHQAGQVEYWNGGVHGYSTAQELLYFKRLHRQLKPDLVVLGFCLNDFDGTPVILNDEKQGNIVVTPRLGKENYNPWLFRNSTLYRLYLSAKASLTGRAGLKEDVTKALQEFVQLSREDGFELRVVVYPLMDRQAAWSDNYRQQYRDIQVILKELKIPTFDMGPLLEQALASHPVPWSRMSPDDYFHPSREFSRIMAQELIAKGLLAP